MTWELRHGDARHVSAMLEPASVDLIVTSPPYFALRSYRDGGEHYDGQIGSEASPTEFVDALIECTADWLKVLRPGGSIFVNLGDKRSGSRLDGSSDGSTGTLNTPRVNGVRQTVIPDGERKGRGRKSGTDGIPVKSLMGLPWRYAIRCIDELGLCLRADIVWHKPNGLPDSVNDRVRQSHEYWFHLTREPRYFAAVDEIREPQDFPEHGQIGKIVHSRYERGEASGVQRRDYQNERQLHPLGKLPGSVWTIPSEPLQVPAELGVDHFAAFPSEWPRRLILGWSPSGWCEGCGEARRPVVERGAPFDVSLVAHRNGNYVEARGDAGAVAHASGQEFNRWRAANPDRILGYACACPATTAPTKPAVVLDPFAGTGTTIAVAHHLGRHGIGIDLSRDYLRLAEWRCTSDTRLRDRVLDRAGMPKAPTIDGQLSLLGDGNA